MNMQLRLPEELHARLKEAAEQDAKSINAEVVTAVEDYLARRQTAKAREFARMVAERDAALLARLAE
jgi:predicted transcriptional regulator